MANPNEDKHNAFQFKRTSLSVAVSAAIFGSGSGLLALSTPAHAQDPELMLEEVFVTAVPGGAADPLEASVSISTMSSDSMALKVSRTTAEVLRSLPGVRSEASGGEGNANIAIRGLPISSGGAKFLQLWEDGLPVLEHGDISFGNADNFTRADTNIARVEAIRGGSAATLASNSPGGVINFISKTGEEGGGSVSITKGLSYDSTRIDAESGYNWDNGWYGHIGGFWRVGEGVRQAGYDVNKGGQFKANLTREFDNGFVRLNAKYLNDRAIGYMPTPMFVSGTNDDPDYSAIPGYDYTADALQSVYTDTINTITQDGSIQQKNLSDGMNPTSKQIGFEISLDDIGGGWVFNNKFKHAINSSEFLVPFPASVADQTARLNIGNYLADPTATYDYANGPVDGPADRTNFSYRYATGPRAGQTLNPSTLLVVAHTFNTELSDVGNTINNMDFSKIFEFGGGSEIETHIGWYHSEQAVSHEKSWPSYLTSVEGDGDTAYVDVIDDASGEALTSGGLISYGPVEWGDTCCVNSFDIDTKIDAFYANNTLRSGNFTVDFGLRYDEGQTTGSRSFTTSLVTRDLNGNGIIEPIERRVPVNDPTDVLPINFEYDYISYTVGGNYLFSDDLSAFARYSLGYRANAERLVDGKVITLAQSQDPTNSAFGKRVGDVEEDEIENEVTMIEVGVKWRFGGLDLNTTLFRAETTESVGQSRAGGDLALRDYEATGIEMEAIYGWENLSINGNVTWTDSEIVKDERAEFEGNTPQRQADWVYSLIASYDTEMFSVGASLNGTTDSFVRDDNVLMLPAYVTVNAFAAYNLTENLSIQVDVNNLLDEDQGLTEGEDAAVGAAEPFNNELVRLRSINGRSAQAKFTYRF